MKRILLLLAVTAVMVVVFVSTAFASGHLPATGGPALLPLAGGVAATGLGAAAWIAYRLRRRR